MLTRHALSGSLGMILVLQSATGADDSQLAEDLIPPPENRRPVDFRPFHSKTTVEEMSEVDSADQIRRADAEFAKMAEINANGRWKPTWESLDRHTAPEWFLDAKLGIMFNWGLHSVPAWDLKKESGAMYPDAYGNQMYHDPGVRNYHDRHWGTDFQWDDFLPLFKAEKYNPAALVELWKEAGARYIIPMSKHHDGIAWWDSQWSKRNFVVMGPKMDLLSPMMTAARKENLKVLLYFCFNEYATAVTGDDGRPYVRNWTWPQGKPTLLELDEANRRRISGSVPVRNCFRHYTTPLIKEAIDRFDPDGLWFDGEWTDPVESLDSRDLAAYFYNKNDGRKEVIVNDRYGAGTRDHHGDYYCSEYNTTQSYRHPWEEVQGISQSFAYNWQDDDERLGTPTELIHRFITIVSNNGNLVIIGGPKASGEYPATVVARFKALGAWLRVNGEAIYATRVLPPYQEGGISYTRSKDGKFAYAICKQWPGRHITLKGVQAAKDATVTMLGFEKPLEWTQSDAGLLISIPDELQAEEVRPCEHAWSLKIPLAKGLEPPLAR